MPQPSAIEVMKNGIIVGARTVINFIAGSNVTLTTSNANDRVDVTISSSGGGPGGSTPTGTGFRHVTSDVEDAEAKLVVNADVDAGAAIAQSKIANLSSDLAGKAASVHSHAIADTTGLQAALDGKAAASHSHLAADLPDASTTGKGIVELATNGETSAGVVVQGNDSRLSDSRTPTAHAHAQTDVTNLVTDLAAKAPLASPALTGVPTAPTAAVGTNTTQVATTAFVLANGGSGGGSTTVIKSADQAVSSITYVDDTVLQFPLPQNSVGAFEFYIDYTTSGTAEGGTLSLNGPATTMRLSAHIMHQGNVANNTEGSAQFLHTHLTNFNSSVVRTAGPSVAGAVNSCEIRGYCKTGAGATGTVVLRIRSETAGGTVTVLAGSWMRYEVQ